MVVSVLESTNIIDKECKTRKNHVFPRIQRYKSSDAVLHISVLDKPNGVYNGNLPMQNRYSGCVWLCTKEQSLAVRDS